MFYALITCLVLFSDSIQTVIVESSVQLFEKAVSLSLTADGNLLVLDQGSNTLNLVDKKGVLKRSIGGQGWGNESFDQPVDVSSSFLLDIFVTDYNNRRIQRFDKNMHLLQTYDDALIGESGRFQPIASTSSMQGELFILDSDNNRIIKLNSRGLVTQEFGSFKGNENTFLEPKDIVISVKDQVYVLDKSRVVIFDIYGNHIKELKLPEGYDWKSINVSENVLIITSSLQIKIIDTNSLLERTITPRSLFGVEKVEYFSDALIQNAQLIILSKTSIYRCSFQ